MRARRTDANGSRGRAVAVALVMVSTLVPSAACRRPSGGRATEATARIPRDAARFEIESVDDSTARFRPFEAKWLRPGMTIYAVDPVRRDALVGRLRIIGSDSGRLVALVTGQVTKVTTDHFLLAVPPTTPWYRTWRFWGGVVTGAAAGAGVSAIAK